MILITRVALPAMLVFARLVALPSSYNPIIGSQNHGISVIMVIVEIKSSQKKNELKY
jgi:hypothetical protein